MDESTNSVLARIIAEMAKKVVPSRLIEIANTIEGLQQSEVRKELELIACEGGDLGIYVRQLLELDWCGGIDNYRAIALALRSAVGARKDPDFDHYVQLVWSGPLSSINRNRTTFSTLIELIENAHESILMFSYVVVMPDDLARALSDASTRGVKIDIALESSQEKDYFNDRRAFNVIGNISRSIATWKWSSDQRNSEKSSMHAKAIAVDRTHLFVTSANLTNAALNDNIELGVLIESERIVREFKDKFEDLVLNEVLKRHGASS